MNCGRWGDESKANINKNMNTESKKNKKIAPKKESHTDEIKRYIGAISEHFQNGIDAIVEQFSGFKKTLDSHTEMIGHILEDVTVLKEDMKEVKSELKEVRGEVKGLQGEMKEVKSELKTMNSRLGSFEQEIKEMKNELQEIKKTLTNKADIERIERFEIRLYALEERLKATV